MPRTRSALALRTPHALLPCVAAYLLLWAPIAVSQPAVVESAWPTQAEPWGINITPTGSFWVCGVGTDSIIEYSAVGSRLRTCGGTGSGPGQFRFPISVLEDPSGVLFVSDYVNARVQKLSGTCSFLTQWPTTWAGGIRCSYAAMDASGNIYVTNLTNIAKKFDQNGTELLSFSAPAAAKLNGAAVDTQGNVYFGDYEGDNIFKFDASAALTGSWKTGPDNNQLAIDSERNRVYVPDYTLNHVEVYTLDGLRIGIFGEAGSAAGQMTNPQGVAIASDHRIYVADRGNNRVQVFHRPEQITVEYQSHGGALPPDSCGMHLTGNGGTVGIVNGLLRFETLTCAQNVGFLSTDTDGDIYIPDSLQISFRFKLVSPGTSCSSARGSAGVQFNTEPNRANTLQIGDNEIFLLSSLDARGATAAVPTTDGLHDYQITVYGDSVWVDYDGVRKLRGVILSDGNFGNQRKIVWGETSSGGFGVSDWGLFQHNAGRFSCQGVPDQSPVVTAPASVSGAEGSHIVANVAASDPDGDPISSITATPLPPRATFTANGPNSAGTLSWWPAIGEAGGYSVVFTASNALTASATTTITVTNAICAPFAGFAPNVEYTTGSLSLSTAIGDMNGDGRSDLAVTSYSGIVSIFLGNGDGTFAPKTDFTTGAGSYAVVIGDWNADNKKDLAVANRDDSTLSVLLGNGDGTFSAKVDYATGTGPISVAAADLNADGRLDLVTANIYASTTSVLLGNGDGTFGTNADFGTGSQPFSVAVGDLTGDGIPDLAVAPNNGLHANVLPGNGDGTFGPAVGLLTGAFPQAVTLGDWNRDGKLDLAVAKDGSNLVSVLLGTGGGAFGSAVDYATTGNAYALGTADFDGDGSLDLAVSNSNAGSVSVLLGNGNGTFASKTDFATTGGTARLAIGDLNGDGRPDIAVGSSSGSSVSVLLNTCTEVTAVPAESPRAPRFALMQNSPNPFNPATLIRFELDHAGLVRLDVYSLGGRLVAGLIRGSLPAGPHSIYWSGLDRTGRPLASGVYFYRLESGDRVEARRMVLLK